MRTLIVLVAAAVALAAGGTAKPQLRLADEQPLVVLGSSFETRELVRVEAVGTFGSRTVRVRATAAGAFRVRFAKLSANPCVLRRIVAVGALGSRAVLRLPPGACADFGPPPG